MDTFSLEAGIVGVLLADSRRAGEIFQILSVDDFKEPLCQNVFQAVQILFRAGAPINAATVSHELCNTVYASSESGTIDKALQAFSAQAAPDVGYYIRCLLDTKKLDDLKSQGFALANASHIDEAQSVVRDIAALSMSKTGNKVKTALELALDFADRLDQTSEKPPEYLDWGLKPLRENLLSELGDFIIIGGRPSAGKTMLALQLGLHLAKNYRVGFVSLETSPEKLTRRAISHLSGVHLEKIKKPWELTEQDNLKIIEAEQKFSELCFDVVGGGARTAAQIEATAINRRWEVVIVDYIQLVKSSGAGRYEQVTNISVDLHTMAQTHGICVVGLAQLSRSVKSAGGKETPPTLESLRESGQLEQDADAVMLLYLENPEDRGSDRILKLAKNKEGECFTTSLFFNGATQEFIYMPPRRN